MRLIDADKLKEEILKWLPSDPCGIAEKEHPIETDIVVSLMMEIEEAPSIDIVRCGECIHNGSFDTDCPFGWKDGEWNMPKPCDYCSYGERSK